MNPMTMQVMAIEDEAISYPTAGNDSCFAVEENSFWFRHRNAVITTLVSQYPPAGPIHDIGGGNGFVSLALEQAGFPTVLVEPGAQGAANARRRGLTRVIHATLETSGIPPRSMPAAGLFDVLEHIEDHVGFLRTIAANLQDQGRLYVTVPAYRWLWAHDDVYAGHFRRYSIRQLQKTLDAAGFELEFGSYLFSFLPVPVFLFRTVPTWFGIRRDPTEDMNRREHGGAGGMAGTVLDAVMRYEQRQIAARKRVPFGSSCLAVARLR